MLYVLCMSPVQLLVLVPESTQSGDYGACGSLSYGVVPSCPNMEGQTAETRVSTGDICLHRQRMCEARGEMAMQTERTRVMKHVERWTWRRRVYKFEARGEMDMQTERTRL